MGSTREYIQERSCAALRLNRSVLDYEKSRRCCCRRLFIKCEDKEPTWLRPTAQTVIELLDLPENWDSYGARPINREIVLFALQLLCETMPTDTPAPTVIPTNRGGVQFEWHTRGIDLEIEIQSPERIYVSYEDQQSGNEWEAELTSDLTRLSDALLELSPGD